MIDNKVRRPIGPKIIFGTGRETSYTWILTYHTVNSFKLDGRWLDNVVFILLQGNIQNWVYKGYM